MKFGPDHYVPVLKIKRGEKAAILAIGKTLHTQITPLLEVVKRKDEKARTVAAHLATAFKDLAASVRPFSRCFLDARELVSDGPSAAEDVFKHASNEGIIFTPVTGISRTADVAAALAHRTHGLALRITRMEMEKGGLAAKIAKFLAVHDLAPNQVDLIIDLGATDDMIADGIRGLAHALLAAVPDHALWHTFTISACAFPPSMGGVERHSHTQIERAEWLAWKDGLYSRRHHIPRLPTFSDCAIQHPKGVEDFDPRTMQVSASVRYTLSDEWLLVKGESTRRTSPGLQFPALATKIAYGHLRAHFAGQTHCAGCFGIKASADGAPKLGSLEVWRRLGTIHHMAVVVDQLRTLPWP